MDDFDYNDESCPSCRHYPTHFGKCDQCEGGYIDVSDEFYEVEGSSFIKCSNCNGQSIQHWCPKCGYDLILEK